MKSHRLNDGQPTITIGRFTTVQILLNLFFRQYLRHEFRRFSIVVTVKIMAAQTGLPAFISDQCGMWDINRIIVQGGILVAVLTNPQCDASSYTQMLPVTANAELHARCLSGFCEFRFHKLGHRMSIVRVFVTFQTLFVTSWLLDKRCCGI